MPPRRRGRRLSDLEPFPGATGGGANKGGAETAGPKALTVGVMEDLGDCLGDEVGGSEVNGCLLQELVRSTAKRYRGMGEVEGLSWCRFAGVLSMRK